MTAYGILAIIILAGAAALIGVAIYFLVKRKKKHGPTESWNQNPVKTPVICFIVAAILIAICVAELCTEF
ncbi:MAG: LPXTG cell wall anchor domain-containing protein [Clostridia bacterium]|nr:LPXTG cell wall anchor domain-containing protein [Clostridia bacterium]